MLLNCREASRLEDMATNPSAAKRVLVYRLGSLGDTLVAMPTLHLVARAFPEAERRMLTSFPPNAKAPASAAILEHTGLISGYFRYTYATRDVRELVTLWWQLLRWRPDVLVYMSGSGTVASAKRNERFFRICGMRKLVGVPLTEDMQRARLKTGAKESGSPVEYEHEASRLARNLAELGDARLDEAESWSLHLTIAERAKATEVLAPIAERAMIAVSFGTKNQSNEWETPNWRALLARLAELYPEYALVVCGAAVEAEASEAAVAGWRDRGNGPVLNLCGRLTPRESAAVFERARVFLGHDSGPTHLAAAVQTPVVAVYGSRNLPGIWFPYGKQHHVLYHLVNCAGCRLQECVVEKKKCILSITVEEVLVQVRRVLEQAPTGDGRGWN